MIKQRFTLYVSMALMLLMWVLPQQASAQTIKCSGGIANLDNVKIQIGCGDWYDISFHGHPGFSYSLSVDNILLGTFSGGNGDYSTGTAKSKFSAGDTIIIVQSCANTGGGTDSDIFRAVLPPDLNMAGTWTFKSDASSATNTPWMASEFTSNSPTNIPTLSVTGDNGRTWAPSCMGSTDGKWTFGATVGTLNTYDGLDSLRYDLKLPLSGSGTITSGSKITVTGLMAGTVSANVIAYSGSCTDTVMVVNVVRDGTDEPTIACNDKIYVSVDATCMAEIHPGMLLAGKSSVCAVTNMDSIVIKHGNGQPIDEKNINRKGDTLIIEKAMEYIHGPGLIAELHSSDGTVSNYCWGNLNLEDKLAPVLECDDKKIVDCYIFNGNASSNIKATDCDPDPIVTIVNQRIITDCHQIGNGNAQDSILKRIIRTYNATDNWGNTSKTCTDTLDVRRLDANPLNNPLTGNVGPLDLRGLIRPVDYLVYNDPSSPRDTNAFVCDSRFPFADADEDHIPDPISMAQGGAGVPRIDTTINGVRWNFALHPSNYKNVHPNVAKLLETCKTVVTFSDQKLPRVGCVEKVIRTFEIREWVCGHETMLRIIQTIEIADTLGPKFDVAVDMKVTTNLKTCERAMRIPAPLNVSDYCKKSETGRTIVNVYNQDGEPIGTLNTDNGTFNAETGGILNIPVGVNKVEYQVFDDCHNVTIDSMKITVVDETAPIAICKEFLVVGIADEGTNGKGQVWIQASAFDNGSYDDCGFKDRCVARMVDLNEFDRLQADSVGNRVGNDPHGAWYVPLDSINDGAACGRIFEKSGTANGVNYIIREDLCTPQIMLCCDDVAKTAMVVFRVEDKSGNRNECMVEVTAQDKRRPTIHCPPDLTIDCRFDFVSDSLLNVFGNVVSQGQQKAINIPMGYVLEVEKGKDLVDGVWFGNCSATVSVTAESDINECRQGTIVRTFIVTSNNGNTAKCKQTITISRKNALKTKDINFPADVTMEGCLDPAMLIPDSTGYPSVNEAECSLVGWAYEDLTVRFNNDDSSACFKIIREWTVIDWCKQPSFTIGTGTQVIVVNDPEAPVITGNANGTCVAVTKTVMDSECKDGQVDLVQKATDNCTEPENLRWTVRIDIDDDGSFNINRSFSGDSADVSGVYPIGTHRVSWEVRDQCGNTDVCEQLFTIENNKKPSPICLTDITGSLMPVDDGSSQNGQPNDDIAGDGIADGGMLTVWADEYDIESSSHPCDYDLVYSFDSLSVVKSKNLTCADHTGTGTTTIPLKVHVLAVTLDKDGEVMSIISSDFCSVVFRLDDNNNTCDTTIQNPANLLISGNIRTESGVNVPTVGVALQAANNGASTIATSTDLGGMYAFGDMPIGGTYKVVPELDKDVLNGVSTLDLVLIQKHILGLEKLGTPYKIIAADINNDNSISAIDLVNLRKVILGFSDKFTNNNSWRFIDQEYEFQRPQDPLNESFTENYNIADLSNNMIIDFIGVKVGDVNGNVNVSGLLTAPRSSANLILNDISFESGETVKVPVSFNGVSEVLGYQFTMEYDQRILKFSGFDSGLLDMKAENFGVQGMDQGYITTSWSSVNAKSVSKGDAFVLEFTAVSAGSLSKALNVTSQVTNAEVYDADAEVLGLGLEFRKVNADIVSGYELFQNTPNPFAQSTTIGFMLAKDAEATINIFDVTGKLVKGYTGSFTKGLNTISIDKSDLGASGVLYYTLDTKEFTSTRRMVLIE
ncbi:MAG: cohesin domain-containing protein [Saprospiraceae bacterium]